MGSIHTRNGEHEFYQKDKNHQSQTSYAYTDQNAKPVTNVSDDEVASNKTAGYHRQ
jgi:hypothetical protein